MLRPVAGEKRERTRRRLTEAAFRVVGERGFHGASVNSIAREANLSTGALYANFASKDAVLFAAFEEHVRWFEASLAATARAADPRAAIVGWIRSLGEQPEQFLVFVEFWAYALRRPELRPELVARMDAMRASLAAAIERRAHDGRSASQMPPELVA